MCRRRSLINAGRKSFKNDTERVAFLFELHQKYTSILPSEAAVKRVTRKKSMV